MKFRIRVKIGDIFQILTSLGVCYGQIMYKHKKWGYIVGIFREFFDETPKDFTKLVARKPDMIFIIPIDYAIRRGIFAIVGDAPLADCNKEFPIFRDTNNPGCGDETLWWLWDGEKSIRLDRPLTEEEKKYPEKCMISAPYMIAHIEDDYRVERDYL